MAFQLGALLLEWIRHSPKECFSLLSFKQVATNCLWVESAVIAGHPKRLYRLLGCLHVIKKIAHNFMHI